MVGSALLPRAAAARDGLRGAAARVEALRPAVVLAPLAAAHVAVAAAVGATATHNGWLYGAAGPAGNDWAAAWALGHLWVPAGDASYGLPALLWPLALAFGGALPAALPVLVVAQVALGGTLLLLAVYGIAARIAGRLFGYAAALAWLLAPLVALAYYYAGPREFLGVQYQDYRGLVHDTVLPNALGLTAFPAFACTVALAGAAWLLVRHLDTGDWGDLLLAGLVTGLAVGIEPTCAIFLPAPALALLLARRFAQLGGYALALLPAVATLALWRQTGLGEASLDLPSLSWDTLEVNLTHFRGAGWSLLFVVWVAAAGAFALIRAAPAKGTLVAGWFVCVVVLQTASPERGRVLDGTLFRAVEPGRPAFVLLAAGLLLLVPGLGRPRPQPRPAARPLRATRGLVAAALGLALYPLVLVALAGPAPDDRLVLQEARGRSVPVSDELELRVEERDGRAALSWEAPPADGVALSYRVYRSPGDGCERRAEGAGDCLLRTEAVATVRGTAWSDPEAGSFRYRVAAVADHRPGRVGGDPLLFGPPAG